MTAPGKRTSAVKGLNRRDSLNQPRQTKSKNEVTPVAEVSITSKSLRRRRSMDKPLSSPDSEIKKDSREGKSSSSKKKSSKSTNLKTPKTEKRKSSAVDSLVVANDAKQSPYHPQPCKEMKGKASGGGKNSSKRKSAEKKNATTTAPIKDLTPKVDAKKMPTVLLDWVIKPVPDQRGICVEGQLEDTEDFWHSTTIHDIREPKLVVTATGSLYRLKGKINKLLALDNGVTREIAKAFSDGFPLNWREMIGEYFNHLEKGITVTDEFLSPAELQKLKAKHRSFLNRTTEPPVDTHSILTPTGLLKKEMSSSEVTKTKSGRASLPPLAGWQGQHYVWRPDTNSVQVSFTTDCAKQALSEETRRALRLSKRDQKMLCRSILSKSLLESPISTGSKPKKKTPSNSSKKDSNLKGSSVAGESTEGKENVLDVSVQPQVSLVDCLTPCGKKGGKEKSPKVSGNLKIGSSRPPSTSSTGKGREKTPRATQSCLSETNATKAKQGTTNSRKKVAASKTKGQLTRSREAPSVSSDSQSKSLQKLGKNSCQTVSSMVAKGKQSKSRKRKVEDVSGEDSPGNAGKCKSGQKAKRQKLDAGDTLLDGGWTGEEKDKFHRALRVVNSDDSNYWNIVAQKVGTKSEEECQQFHRDFLEKKTFKDPKPASKVPKNQKKDTGRQKGGPIRGGKGTLKRKQDLRDFLDEQNEGYEDDLFECSPFVKMKRNPVVQDFAIDFGKDDSEIFGANHNFFTPVAGRNPFDTPGFRVKAQLASVRKTPANLCTASTLDFTPMAVNNRQHDVYIKNFMDKKNKPTASTSSLNKEMAGSSHDLETSVLPIKSLFPASNSKIMFDNHEEEDEDDDDEEEDNGNQFRYYWSDGD